MNQAAINSLRRRECSTHLIGRIWVRRRVTTRYWVSRDREAAQCCWAVGKLNLFILWWRDFECGRAVDSICILVANETPAWPTNLFHVATAVKGCDPFISQRCWVLQSDRVKQKFILLEAGVRRQDTWAVTVCDKSLRRGDGCSSRCWRYGARVWRRRISLPHLHLHRAIHVSEGG